MYNRQNSELDIKREDCILNRISPDDLRDDIIKGVEKPLRNFIMMFISIRTGIEMTIQSGPAEDVEDLKECIVRTILLHPVRGILAQAVVNDEGYDEVVEECFADNLIMKSHMSDVYLDKKERAHPRQSEWNRLALIISLNGFHSERFHQILAITGSDCALKFMTGISGESHPGVQVHWRKLNVRLRYAV
jgi:hypothetical protein